MEAPALSEEPISRAEFEMLQDSIQEHKANLKDELGEIKKQLKAMWSKMDGRPSWAVLSIITFLSSLVAVLLTLVLSR